MLSSSSPVGASGVLIVLGLVTMLTACSPHRVPAVESNSSARQAEATVFTDTALYRRVCTQADSGLTPASGRCTPRDQSVRPVKPQPPAPPARP